MYVTAYLYGLGGKHYLLVRKHIQLRAHPLPAWLHIYVSFLLRSLGRCIDWHTVLPYIVLYMHISLLCLLC